MKLTNVLLIAWHFHSTLVPVRRTSGNKFLFNTLINRL